MAAPIRLNRRQRDKRCSSARLLLQLLFRYDIDTVFYLPGAAIDSIMDAMLDDDGLRWIMVKHEASAALAAAGYAFATGKPAAVVVTSGPGLLNSLTGVAACAAENLPMVLISGEVSRPLHGHGVIQDGSTAGLNVLALTKNLCKHAVEVTHAANLQSQVAQAIGIATSGVPGPVHISVPRDVGAAQAMPTLISHRPRLVLEIEEAVLDRCAEAINKARHPVVLAGAGVRTGRGPEALRKLAAALRCPIITTAKGKGVFPEDHPQHCGILGLGGHPSARRSTGPSNDMLLALGTGLNDLVTHAFRADLLPSRTLVHVDIEASRIGRHYETDVAVVAYAEDFIDALLPKLRERAPSGVWGIERQLDAEDEASSDPAVAIPTHRALWELSHIVPDDAVWAVDAGEYYFAAQHCLQSRRPGGFMVMTGLGTMGMSLAAIGLQVAEPDRMVLALMGDGTMLMHGTELITAVEQNLPVRFVVFNNSGYGMVRDGLKGTFGRAASYGFGAVDISQMARSMGLEALVIEHPGEILKHAHRIRNHPGPLLLDVRIDGNVTVPREVRVERLQ